MVYVDNGICLGNDNNQITEAIQQIQSLGLNIGDQGHPADYVGINIRKLKDGSYEFTQGAQLDSIIQSVGLDNAKGIKPVPAKISLCLHAAKNEKPFDLDFNYWPAVGKLNYLAQTTPPDIMYATHQIVKYASDPREIHGEAILYLVRY